MRLFVLLILLVVFLSSCSKYQCVSISSDDVLQRNEKNEFIVENDTIRIAYSFTDNSGAAVIYVFNKSNKRLNIDWSRSFLIAGGNPVAFYNPEIKVTGELEKPGYTDGNLQLSAIASTPQPLQFIPPFAGASRVGARLTNGKFFDPRHYSFSKEKIKSVGLWKKIKRAPISPKNSPLHFRIYLTIVPSDNDQDQPMVLDRSFYVSELIQTRADVDDLFPKQRNRNMIRMEKSTTAGAVLTAVGLVGLMSLLIVAAGR